MTMTNLRGKCKEYAEKAVEQDPSLRLVRGWYYCPQWGQQAHWWAVREDGTIVDPTASQFPSQGHGVYEEFDGIVPCAECGAEMQEVDVPYTDGRFAFCSYECYGYFVGMGVSR